MARKRFTSKKASESFAKRVNGKVNDLREIPDAKSKFTVTYEKTEKTRAHGQGRDLDWAPEEDRDFGYPNDFWK